MHVENGPQGWDTHDYGFVHVHETATGRLIAMLPSSSRWGRIGPMCFSGEGRRLALAGIDGTVQIWDLPP